MESEGATALGSAAPRLTAARGGEYHPRTRGSDVPPDHHAGRVPYDLRFVARKAPVTPPR